MRNFYIYICKDCDLFKPLSKFIDGFYSNRDTIIFVKWEDGKFDFTSSGSFAYSGDREELEESDDGDGYDSIFIMNNDDEDIRLDMLKSYVTHYHIISILERL